MKKILKFILKNYLRIFAKIFLVVNKPVVIVVAGSINKFFVKEKIKEILISKHKPVHVSPNNFNTEIGLSLAVLNLISGYNSYRAWLPIILKAPLRVFRKKLPEYLVLDLGTSDKGDIDFLLSIIGRPDICVITNINQRHLEGFNDMNDLVREYKSLVDRTKASGTVILNYDNPRVRDLGIKSKSTVVYYGREDGADWKIKRIKRGEKGEVVEVTFAGSKKVYELNRFGEHHLYSHSVALIINKLIS